MSVEYKIGWIVGVLVGIAVVMLVVLAIIKWGRKKGMKKCVYDERQNLIRGKAFKYGFITLALYNLLFGGVDLTELIPWCDSAVVSMLGTAVAFGIWGGYCIWNDAYVSLSERPTATVLILSFCGLLNIVVGICNLLCAEKGTGHSYMLNLILGILLLLLSFLQLIKNMNNRRLAEQRDL